MNITPIIQALSALEAIKNSPGDARVGPYWHQCMTAFNALRVAVEMEGLTVAISNAPSVDTVLDAYNAESCGDEVFRPTTLQSFIDRFPQYRGELIRYAAVHLSSATATREEVEAEDVPLPSAEVVERMLSRARTATSPKTATPPHRTTLNPADPWPGMKEK
jgi:hypothetical protein